MASALTWKLPLAIACFMASTFSLLKTSLPPEPMAETVEGDKVTVTPAGGLADVVPAAAATAAAARQDSGDYVDPEAVTAVRQADGTYTANVSGLADGVLLAQVVFDSVDYIVPKQELMQPFIKEFGNGTVVDRVMIRKVQDNKELPASYYLVGLGIRNGSFRSMALELGS